MPRRSYTVAPRSCASLIIRHWTALLGCTSRRRLVEAPYEYQTWVPTVSIVAAERTSPSWWAR